MRYFIFFGYDGTNYHGWQIQPNANSVQQELQRALSILLRKEIEVVGAGRTDTGVHARNMAAHFEAEITMELDQLVYRLNRILPRDIAVYEVQEVNPEMHARFSATSRTYHYYIHTKKDPFERHYSLQINYPLDFEKMNEGSDLSHYLVFRNHRQPFPEKHGESRGGYPHRCGQGKDYDGAVPRHPAQWQPQRCGRKHAR